MSIFEGGAADDDASRYGGRNAGGEFPPDGIRANEMEGMSFLPTDRADDRPYPQDTRPAFGEHDAPALAEKIYAVDEAGAIRPRDLLTGEILQPGGVPPCLLLEPEIREGFEFWEQHGSEVRFRFLGTAHGTAKDLDEAGFDLHAEAERLAAAGGVLCLEGRAKPPLFRSAEMLYKVSAAMPAEKIHEFYAILDSKAQEEPEFAHGAAIVKHIAGTGVQTACVDYVIGGNRPADAALTALHAAYAADKSGPGVSAEQAINDHFGTHLTYDFYRNYHFLGRMGAIAAAKHNEGVRPDLAWLGGVLHAPIAMYAAERGARVEAASSPHITPYRLQLMDCIRRGEITLLDQQILMTFLSDQYHRDISE